MSSSNYESLLREFAQAFDDSDLDKVMAYFSEDAVYRTIQANTIMGKEAIREELSPQFNGAYGRMNFEVTDFLWDETKRKATLVWTCRHDLTHKANGHKNNLTRLLYKAINGSSPHWQGLDIFELDQKGKILLKASYTTSKIPRIFKK